MKAVCVEIIEMRTALQIQSVFLKMSESKHLDSEFYYPGELSDAEMLQLLNEATERKSLLSNHEDAKQCCHTRVLVPPKKLKWKKMVIMLIDWVRLGLMGKYLDLGQDARTLLHSVCTSWPQAKYFPVQPSHSVNKYILLVSILTFSFRHRFYNVVVFARCIFQVYVKACWHHTALKFYFLSSTPYASCFVLILNLCIMMLLNCFNLESFLSAILFITLDCTSSYHFCWSFSMSPFCTDFPFCTMCVY